MRPAIKKMISLFFCDDNFSNSPISHHFLPDRGVPR
jgi:hypothetical protein